MTKPTGLRKETTVPYDYQTQRPRVFTDEGQLLFLEIRDRTHYLIQRAGVARMDKILSGVSGDWWDQLACVDRLVEIGEVYEVPNTMDDAGQYRLFTSFVLPKYLDKLIAKRTIMGLVGSLTKREKQQRSKSEKNSND